MRSTSRDVTGGWYKDHDYTLRVGPVAHADKGRRFGASIVLILHHGPTAATSGWPEVRGWPEHHFFGDTEGDALHAAGAAAKTWIDANDEARWSGVT